MTSGHSPWLASLLVVPTAMVLLLAAGCIKTQHDVNLKVEPLHITMDVNIRVRKALDDYFSFEDQMRAEAGSQANQPATTTDEAKGTNP